MTAEEVKNVRAAMMDVIDLISEIRQYTALQIEATEKRTRIHILSESVYGDIFADRLKEAKVEPVGDFARSITLKEKDTEVFVLVFED